MELLAAVRAVAVVPFVTIVPGWIGVQGDLFMRTWAGVVMTCLVGLALAYAGCFSLPATLAGVGAVSVCLGVGRRYLTGCCSPKACARQERSGLVAIRALACAAGLSAALWSWPPFETVIAASDSTMYVNAGIHLARTGSLAVHDTIVPLLPEGAARALFASVRLLGTGPYIRLPGGLLMGSLAGGEASEATPAFFPLTPVWSAIVAAAGGPEAAPVAAPVFVGLAVWAVVLFAGETFGLASAGATAVLVLANFTFWWFGRFLVSEPLTAAFVWGGMVLLGRGSPLVAGLLFGMAGLARTETFPFLFAAVAFWAALTRVPGRQVVALAAGIAPVAAVAVLTVLVSPSHHRAYFLDEIYLNAIRVAPAVVWAARQGHLTVAAMLGVGWLLLAGAIGRWRGIGFVRTAVLSAVTLALLGALGIYVRYGGPAEPVRHVRWLAAYCSWPLVALAGVGGVMAWRRGGPSFRLAIVLWLVVAAFFVVNPRVAQYHPWAMRRFLPVVIPGILVAAGTALAVFGSSARRWRRMAAAVAMVLLAGLELRPIVRVYWRDYFGGSFEAVRALARALPEGAIVAMDGDFADAQIQVPLWLVHGHEVVMLYPRGPNWRAVMPALVASARPVYWIGSSFGANEIKPQVPGLEFQPVLQTDFAVRVPEGPPDDPPSRTVTRLLPLLVYSVRRTPTA